MKQEIEELWNEVLRLPDDVLKSVFVGVFGLMDNEGDDKFFEVLRKSIERQRCQDCKGTGWYSGRYSGRCKSCSGRGWL